MAQYTEADIENALADVASGVPTATAAAQHGIPRATLYGRISGSQHHKSAHANVQQLSIAQEEHLAHLILRQESLNYAPTHAQVCTIATGILKQAGDHCCNRVVVDERTLCSTINNSVRQVGYGGAECVSCYYSKV